MKRLLVKIEFEAEGWSDMFEPLFHALAAICRMISRRERPHDFSLQHKSMFFEVEDMQGPAHRLEVERYDE